MNRQRRVLIIGCGVSALSSARLLQEHGYAITIITESKTKETTSAVAGALWELPPAVCGYPQGMTSSAILHDQKRSLVSYHKFLDLAKTEGTGVYLYPVNFYFKETINCDPIEKFKIEEAKDKLINFRHDQQLILENRINPALGYCDAYSYLTPVVDMDTYLEWLFDKVIAEPSTKVIMQKIEGNICKLESSLLQQYDADVIVNCAGLGASQLTEDLVFPVRGGLIYIENNGQQFEKIQQVHCTSLPSFSGNDGTFIFILPRGENHLVLGGIAEVNQKITNLTPENYIPYKQILNLCQDFLPELKNAVIVKHKPLMLGLRPFRKTGARIEHEEGKKIVHNYGHGGAGVLLSWGCAEEVVSLVKMMF
ncbi:MAG: FAD-dependent oxidoreductase [Microcystis aeruginosa G11-01]|nr:FAD-dependent oxidoreductase [Microcystis aeruginosa G11-01]